VVVLEETKWIGTIRADFVWIMSAETVTWWFGAVYKPARVQFISGLQGYSRAAWRYILLFFVDVMQALLWAAHQDVIIPGKPNFNRSDLSWQYDYPSTQVDSYSCRLFFSYASGTFLSMTQASRVDQE
jgi:hypothetical protein